jgi:hypothetical protein
MTSRRTACNLGVGRCGSVPAEAGPRRPTIRLVAALFKRPVIPSILTGRPAPSGRPFWFPKSDDSSVRNPTEAGRAWAQCSDASMEEWIGSLNDIFELLSAYALLSLACAVGLSFFSRATKRSYDERILTRGW